MVQDRQQLKEEIRSRSDIVQVIGAYTRLKRSGKNWTGLCPFHSDKRPSFSVSPLLQSYKCWSCGEHGDVFEFVMRKEGLEFLEAMEELARRADIPFEIGPANPERASEKEAMRDLNGIALAFFHDRLARSAEARDYLARRALLKSTQEQFEIGYAAPEWEGLVFRLQEKRCDLALAAKIGLIKVRAQEGSGYYDAYRDRIIFPIHDIMGRVVGFGGRALRAEEPAKYINSDSSALFDKSRTVYGLNFARKRLATDVPPVFVEGYLDVVTAHQAGFSQCVATLGTAMTEGQARMLAQYNPRVIICYDADRAGISAALKGSEIWEGLGLEGAEVRIARLPAGEDPDSLLRNGDVSRFQAALDAAVGRAEFQIDLALEHHGLDTPDGRDAALAEAISVLATVRSLTQRDRLAQRCAHLHPSYAVNIDRALAQILADAEAQERRSAAGLSARDRGYPLTERANGAQLVEMPQPPTYRPATPARWGKSESAAGWKRGERDGARRSGGGRQEIIQPLPPGARLTGAEKAERHLLRAALSPEWRSIVLSRVPPEEMVTETGRGLLEAIARTQPDADGGIEPLALLRWLTPEQPAATAPTDSDESASVPQAGLHSAKIADLLRELLEDSLSVLSNEPLNEAAVFDCMQRLREYRRSRDLRDLTEALHRAGLTPEREREIKMRLIDLTRAMRGSPDLGAPG